MSKTNKLVEALNYLKALIEGANISDIQLLSPTIKVGIENLIKSEQNFNITLLVNRNPSEPKVIVTPMLEQPPAPPDQHHEQVSELMGFITERSESRQKTSKSQQIREFPFNMGLYILIDQESFWKFDQNPVEPSEALRIIPLEYNRLREIKTFEGGKYPFRVLVKLDGTLEVETWISHNYERQRFTVSIPSTPASSPTVPPKRLEHQVELSQALGSGRFLCHRFVTTRYDPGDLISVNTIPKVVLELGKKVVDRAFLLEYEPPHSSSEFFLLVLRGF